MQCIDVEHFLMDMTLSLSFLSQECWRLPDGHVQVLLKEPHLSGARQGSQYIVLLISIVRRQISLSVTQNWITFSRMFVYFKTKIQECLYISKLNFSNDDTCQRKSHWATPPRATPVQRTVLRSEFGIGFSMSGFGIAIQSCASKSLLQSCWVPYNNASERKDDIHFIRLNNIAALEQEEFIGKSTSRSCEDDWLHSLCPSLQRAASILIRSFSSRKSSFGLSYLSPGHSKIQFLTLLRDSPQNLVCRREVVVRWACKTGADPIQSCASSCSPGIQSCKRKVWISICKLIGYSQSSHPVSAASHGM